MPLHSLLRPAALSLVVISLLTGCGGEAPPPEAISTQDVVAGVPDLFKNAAPEVQKLASEAVAAINAQDYPTAWDRLQTLNTQSGLNDEQKNFIAQSIASVGAEVNKAEESGNEAAAEAARIHRLNK